MSFICYNFQICPCFEAQERRKYENNIENAMMVIVSSLGIVSLTSTLVVGR